MSLEPEEKVAGRLFRDRAQADLEEFRAAVQPEYDVPVWIASYRHLCAAKACNSIALELPEVFVSSPRIVVETDDAGQHKATFFDEWMVNNDCDQWIVPAGRFGFVYRSGHCPSCNERGVSPKGLFVDAWERPPIQGFRAHR